MKESVELQAGDEIEVTPEDVDATPRR